MTNALKMKTFWAVLAILLLAGSASAEGTCVDNGACNDTICSEPFTVGGLGFVYHGDYNYCSADDLLNFIVTQVGNNTALCGGFWGLNTSSCVHVYSPLNTPNNLFCPYRLEAGHNIGPTDCLCGATPCAGNEVILSFIDFTAPFFYMAPVIPLTGMAVGAQVIEGVGTIIFAVVTLTGAIVAIVAAFAVLTLVTHTIKALSGPLTKGLQ